jgi:hypothetical protein
MEPSVCDGCDCDGCATFRAPDATSSGPCPRAGMHLDSDGAPIVSTSEPRLIESIVERDSYGTCVVRATVEVPQDVQTQPPIVNALGRFRYGRGETFTNVSVVAGGVVHSYPALAGAWRVMIGVEGEEQPRWAAALVDEARDPVANGINARIPATAGRYTVTVSIDGVGSSCSLWSTMVQHPGGSTPTN